jgi:hypothetical protein
MVHLKVIGVATAFGLGAYAVVQGLIHLSKAVGLLEWLAR